MPPYETGVPGLLMANTTQVYPEDRGTNYAVREAEEVVAALLARHDGLATPTGGIEVSSGERLLPQVVLAVAVAGAACAAFTSALTLAVGNTEGVDAAVFVFAFAVLLPVSVGVVARGGPLAEVDADIVSTLAGVAAIGLALVLAVAKLADELAADEVRSAAILLALAVVWLAAIAVLSCQGKSRPRAFAGRPHGTCIFLLAAPDAPPDRRRGARVGCASAARRGLAVAASRLPCCSSLTARCARAGSSGAGERSRSTSQWWRRSCLWSATCPSSLRRQPPGASSCTTTPCLAPQTTCVGGRSMLVDTYSIYGVGSIYFLGGLFEIVPIGYGAFGLLVGIGLAVLYAGGYAIMRLAGCSQVLAVTAMAAAIVSSVYSTIASPATFPSLGILRWGFGYLLVGLAVWSARQRRRTPAIQVAGAVIVGIASIWSFEVFVYTAATYLALLAYEAASQRRDEGWLRPLAISLLPAAGACVVAHLALVGWTVARAGQLPSWDPYIAMVREFSSGPYNRVVAPPWWVGIPVCAVLFASAIAVAAIVTRLPRFESENRPALVAIAGLTVFAVATFTLRSPLFDRGLRRSLGSARPDRDGVVDPPRGPQRPRTPGAHCPRCNGVLGRCAPDRRGLGPPRA